MPEVFDLMKQYHSVTIGAYNTWRDYKLIATSPPVVVPPKVKTNFVEVPGSDGSLDFTEALDGQVHYGLREGQWEFVVNHEEIQNYNWAYLWSRMLSDFHGKRNQVLLLDEYGGSDDAYFYVGRVMLDEWMSDPYHSKVTMSYIFEPYKYATLADAQAHTNGVF